MNEAELSQQIVELTAKFGYWFTVAGIGFVLLTLLKDFWGDVIIFCKIKIMDNPRFTKSIKSEVEVKIEGEWWRVEAISPPLLGNGLVELRRSVCDKDNNCVKEERTDMSLYDYYKKPIRYRINPGK